MATTVQSFVGGGTDLTELTSGELLFCSLLKTGCLEVYTTRYGSSDTHVTFGRYDPYIDMSKISQISFKSRGYPGSVDWLNSSDGTRIEYNQNASFSLTAPSKGDNSRSHITISSDNENETYLEVVSFTTIDGKVHTADNLNY